MSDTPFTVFFGSSTESQGFMETVASWIEPQLNVHLILWNTAEAFPAGSYTFDRLLELTRICHAAVFIFGKDDKLVRQGRSKHYQPRDNVLIEYGLFASWLGVKNTLICRTASSRVATDLLGITTINFPEGPTLAGKDRVLSWFSECRRRAARPPSGQRPTEERPSGVVGREALRASDRRLSGEVFALELLRSPVTIERTKNGHVTVTVDRKGVQEMLISNEGKLAATRRYVTPGNIGRLTELDREIHDFLATGSGQGQKTIDLQKEGICLRWASGGILTIVTDAGGKRWVPLFFRDIRPYGWNLALGTSERWFTADGLLKSDYSLDTELSDPWQYIQREFLEESLIVAGTPRQGGTLALRNFSFGHAKLPFSVARGRQFDDEHCRLRKEEDGLTIDQEEGYQTEVELCRQKCTLRVVSDSSESVPTDDVLVCFSLLDLGIEVVKVAEYQLEPGDYMLDGEIKERYSAETGETEKALVRMPIALISLDYLRDTFGRSQDWQRYTFGPQPSIQVAKAPDPERGEILVFDWDVERRLDAIAGKWDAKSLRNRFLDWYDKFGEHFMGDLTAAKPSRLFVPGTAKILNLYFRHNRG